MLYVIYRKRDNLIENILLKFNEIYNDYNNIVESEIITTSKLDDENLEYIKSFARKITKKNIFLKENGKTCLIIDLKLTVYPDKIPGITGVLIYSLIPKIERIISKQVAKNLEATSKLVAEFVKNKEKESIQ